MTCPLCGGPRRESDACGVRVHYRDLMDEDGRCLDCAYWPRALARVIRDPERHVVAGGVHLIIAPEGTHAEGRRGHGGRAFTLRDLRTGAVVETRNLWNNGQTDLPDSHEIIPKEESEDGGKLHGA